MRRKDSSIKMPVGAIVFLIVAVLAMTICFCSADPYDVVGRAREQDNLILLAQAILASSALFAGMLLAALGLLALGRRSK